MRVVWRVICYKIVYCFYGKYFFYKKNALKIKLLFSLLFSGIISLIKELYILISF